MHLSISSKAISGLSDGTISTWPILKCIFTKVIQITFMLLYGFRMDMMHVLGTGERRVPILLNRQCKTVMEHLRSTRHIVGIPEQNQFFFASLTDDGHLDARETLKSVAADAGCKQMNISTPSQMEKYLATVCQVC